MEQNVVNNIVARWRRLSFTVLVAVAIIGAFEHYLLLGSVIGSALTYGSIGLVFFKLKTPNYIFISLIVVVTEVMLAMVLGLYGINPAVAAPAFAFLAIAVSPRI